MWTRYASVLRSLLPRGEGCVMGLLIVAAPPGTGVARWGGGVLLFVVGGITGNNSLFAIPLLVIPTANNSTGTGDALRIPQGSV